MAKQILLCFGVCGVISIERRGWVNTASSIELHIVNTQRSLTIMRCYEQPLSSLCGFYRRTFPAIVVVVVYAKQIMALGRREKKKKKKNHTAFLSQFSPTNHQRQGRWFRNTLACDFFLFFFLFCFCSYLSCPVFAPAFQVIFASFCRSAC